jgi:hypothetical protein
VGPAVKSAWDVAAILAPAEHTLVPTMAFDVAGDRHLAA